jgi:ribosomal protein S18 acetylase RimI-like enzyme
LPGSLHTRPLRVDDAQRWADLLAAVEEVDRRGEHYDAADLAEELTDPELDLTRDSLLVLDADGRAVAYQVLRLRSPDGLGPGVVVDAAVHPAYRRRGIGTALITAAPTSMARRSSCGFRRRVPAPSRWPSAAG